MLRQRHQNSQNESVDFASMRQGLKTKDNVLIDLGTYKKTSSRYGDKSFILRAMTNRDMKTLIEISNYYYENSGIYYSLCRYLATLYRFDWYVTPFRSSKDEKTKQRLLKDFSKVLAYLDKSDVKRLCGGIALDIIKEGAFYGILVDLGERFGVQKLPSAYCRSRYSIGLDPIVELNLQFFDAYFSNVQYRIQVLKTFPKEIQKAYIQYKEGKLKGDYPGDLTCWVPLDPGTSIKLSLTGGDFPILVNVIPSIIDLDAAQELDRQKTMQQLLKIIVQKLPLDKNGDLIFDVDEARDIHNNAVAMLKRGVGIDVLTTFADIEKIDTKDTNSATTTDDLERVERTVFNNSGITQNLFNAEGNLAVTNSVLVDVASIREFPLLFTNMLNRIVERFNRKDYTFRLVVLETTSFDYKDMSKMYKEQAQLGYNKILTQVALGHPQSTILATLDFENEVLHLADIMTPPMSSNTMSAKALGKTSQSNSSENEKEVGRPKKEETEKSDKTLQNEQSE